MDPIIQTILLGLLVNGLTAFIAQLGHKDSKLLLGEELLEKMEWEKNALQPILQRAIQALAEGIEWQETPKLEVVCLFLLSPQVESIVQKVYEGKLSESENYENLVSLKKQFLNAFFDFTTCYTPYTELKKDQLVTSSMILWNTLIDECQKALNTAIDKGILSAHEAQSAYRSRLLLEGHASIEKRLEAVERQLTSLTLLKKTNKATATEPITDKIDLDLASRHVEALERLLDYGDPLYVFEEAKRWSNMRFTSRDTRAIETKIRYRMLLANAQETVLPWTERILPSIHAYNSIEYMLRSLPLRKIPSFQNTYADILAHRAPLYTEVDQFEHSMQEFTIAIEQCLSEIDDLLLCIRLYCGRALVWAAKGNVENWLRDLDTARTISQQASETQRKQLLSMIASAEGEGNMRLAYNLDLSQHERDEYAVKGIVCLDQSRREISQKPRYAVFNKVVEAQCLILIDPDEAGRRAEFVRIEAQQIYPSLVWRIDWIIKPYIARLRMHP